MTVREKVREKEEAEDSTVLEKENEASESEAALDREAQMEEVENIEIVSHNRLEVGVPEELESFKPLMPEWGDSEHAAWMYFVPTTQEGVRRWAKEWADFLIEWAYHNNQHVFSFSTFIREPPFCEINNKTEAFSEIAESMLRQGLAEWRNEQRRKLQLMWKSKKEIADDLYQWALKTGSMHLDLRSLMIREEFDFGGLSGKDIEDILGIIVQTGRAEWIDKNRIAIRLKT